MDENRTKTGARLVMDALVSTHVQPKPRLREDTSFLNKRANFILACLQDNTAEVKRLIKTVAPRLGRITRKHCVYACVRRGSVRTLRTLINGGFAVPAPALLYLPLGLPETKIQSIGVQLLLHGASALSVSWTNGTVLMTVLPHCYSAAGVLLLRLVLLSGAGTVQLPHEYPARNLETANAVAYVYKRLCLGTNVNWADAAVALLGERAAVATAIRLGPTRASHALKLLVESGCDPRPYAPVLQLPSLSGLTVICGVNRYAPHRVRETAWWIFACNCVRQMRKLATLPNELLFLIVAHLPWTRNQ